MKEKGAMEETPFAVDVICPVVSTNSRPDLSSSLRLPQPDGRAKRTRSGSGFALSAISCFNHRLAGEGERERRERERERKGITAFRPRPSGAEAAANQTRWSSTFETTSYFPSHEG